MDIILMIIFSYKNYKLAAKRDESPWKWAIITAMVWLIFEFLGFALYSMIAEIDVSNMEEWSSRPGEMLLVVLFSVACAYLGYLLVRRSLQGKTEDSENNQS